MYEIIYGWNKEEKINVSILSEKCNCTVGKTSKILNNLIKRKLVCRHIMRKDGKVSGVYFTCKQMIKGKIGD